MLAGTVMSATFELEGQTFMALNGNPQCQFTEAISLYVNCTTQAEVDDLWTKLTGAGEDGTLVIWDTTNWGQITVFRHQAKINALDWRSDSRMIATASDDGTVKIWDVNQKHLVQNFSYPGYPYAVDWSPDGSKLAYGGLRTNEMTARAEIVDAATLLDLVAHAGEDRVIMAGINDLASVSLDASQSYDTLGTITRYEWSENGIQLTTGVNPPVDFSIGVHHVSLTITNDSGLTDTDELVVIVFAPTPTPPLIGTPSHP